MRPKARCKYNKYISYSQPNFSSKCRNVTFRPSFCLYHFEQKAHFLKNLFHFFRKKFAPVEKKA